MGNIITVTGAAQHEKLGFCQSHEHLFLAKGRSFDINVDLCIDDFEKSRDELQLYFQYGGRAVVDAQPLGCGRDAAMLEKLSRESGVSIIASTGFHKLIFYPEDHWIYKYTSDKLARIYIEELSEGMYALCDEAEPCECLGCCAGQIKSALDAGEFTDEYRKLFTAAAAAAIETGCALMVHIEAGSNPLALADFLYRENVPSSRLIFCHLDRAVPGLGIHKELCSRGITLEYDTVARFKYHDDDRECQILLEMIEAGWDEQILMSLDTTRARLKSYGGSVGLDYILKQFIPRMKDCGLTSSIIEKIFVTNPARIFSQE